MKQFIIAVLGLVAVAFVTGCRAPLSHGAKVSRSTPSWYSTVDSRNVDRSKPVAYLVGRGQGSSSNQQIAVQMAKIAAFADVGVGVQARFTALQKTALEQTGNGADGESIVHFSQAAKVVVDDLELGGTAVRQQVLNNLDGTFYCWTAIEYPLGEANQRFLDALKANRATYERFRATKLYEEMNQEADKLRARDESRQPKP
jgi:hypothetical protein